MLKTTTTVKTISGRMTLVQKSPYESFYRGDQCVRYNGDYGGWTYTKKNSDPSDTNLIARGETLSRLKMLSLSFADRLPIWKNFMRVIMKNMADRKWKLYDHDIL